MQAGAVVDLAKKAAALSRTEPAARLAAMRPVRNYRGIQQRKNRYYLMIWDISTRPRRIVWLGSYKTPEEAAYAWDAAARVMRGHRASPNFPEPDWARAPEEVSTELVLAPPPLAATPAGRCEPPAALAAQASLDNSLQSASAAAAEPQQLTPKDLLLQIGLPGRGGLGGAQ